MRTKTDYSKQFELVVKQEIKNYNDTVLNTNLALENCRQGIEDLANKTSQRFSEQESNLLNQSMSLGNVKDTLIASHEQLCLRIREVSQKIDKSHKTIKSLIDDLENKLQEKDEFYRVITEIKNQIASLTDQMTSLRDLNSQEIQKAEKEFKNKLEETRKEVLAKPSEAEIVERKLEKKLEVVNVNYEGFAKEILVFKKAVMIIEKKLENIYTLIERINGRIK